MRSWNGWQVISVDLLDRLPEVPGVFELGTLVRSVLYIAAAGQGIQSEVRRALDSPALQLRAHCVRFEAHLDPAALAAEWLGRYRQSHGGALPPAQPADLTLLSPRAVVQATLESDAVESRGKRSGHTVFLRIAS